MPFHKFPFQNALNAHIFLAMKLSNGLGFNSLMTEAVIIQKPVHGFALQIDGLVSI